MEWNEERQNYKHFYICKNFIVIKEKETISASKVDNR